MSAEESSLPDVKNLEILDDIDSSYKPPPEKSLNELLNADTQDESLQKYKEKLLGEATSGKIIFGEYTRAVTRIFSKIVFDFFLRKTCELSTNSPVQYVYNVEVCTSVRCVNLFFTLVYFFSPYPISSESQMKQILVPLLWND